jgi:hypothetical protein
MDKKRGAEFDDPKSKRQKMDPEQIRKMIEEKQREIAERLKAMNTIKPKDGMSDEQKRIHKAKMKQVEDEAQKQAKMVLTSY